MTLADRKVKYMADWGKLPWENDQAADWFARLFQRTNLAQWIGDKLSEDIHESEDNLSEIRAAISLMVLLGRGGVYPSDKRREHTHLAISKARDLRNYLSRNEDRKDLVSELDNEVAALERRKQPKPDRSEPSSDLRSWWQTWL